MRVRLGWAERWCEALDGVLSRQHSQADAATRKEVRWVPRARLAPCAPRIFAVYALA